MLSLVRRALLKVGNFNLRRGRPAAEAVLGLPVTAVSTCERYDLQRVRERLAQVGVATTEVIRHEALCARVDGKEVMVLSLGLVVAWGVGESEARRGVVELLKAEEVRPFRWVETEELDYVEGERAHVDHPNELIVVDASPLSKVAFSTGLARSTQLAVIEHQLEEYILRTRVQTEQLRRAGTITTGEATILSQLGEIFELRNQLNLYHDLVDMPDVLWAESELERMYREISRELDVAPRISILNRKLDYVKDEAEALLAALHERKGTRLEWIIIVLIAFEVCMEVWRETHASLAPHERRQAQAVLCVHSGEAGAR